MNFVVYTSVFSEVFKRVSAALYFVILFIF